MVTEEGSIEKILGQNALVRIQKSSCCKSCDSRSTCQVISDGEMLIEVANDLQAKVGDRVEVGMPMHSLLKLSLLVYFIPVVALIVGAYAGGAWAQSLHAPSTLASIAGGGCAMGSTFYALRWLDRAAGQKAKYRPQMTRILPSAHP